MVIVQRPRRTEPRPSRTAKNGRYTWESRSQAGEPKPERCAWEPAAARSCAGRFRLPHFRRRCTPVWWGEDGACGQMWHKNFLHHHAGSGRGGERGGFAAVCGRRRARTGSSGHVQWQPGVWVHHLTAWPGGGGGGVVMLPKVVGDTGSRRRRARLARHGAIGRSWPHRTVAATAGDCSTAR